MHTCIFIKRKYVCISIKKPCTQGCLGSLWNLNYMFLRDISNVAQYIYTINVQVDQKILDSLSLFFFFYKLTCVTENYILMMSWLKAECRVNLIKTHCKKIQYISNLRTVIKNVDVIYWELNKWKLEEMLFNQLFVENM